MSANQEKLFAGARLRRLRKELGQTQAQFAESLNVSPSYLNLLERNQRPVTARVLLSLAEAFDVDVRAFAAESDRQLLADLKEAAADPVLKSTDLDARDVQELADAHPRAAEALIIGVAVESVSVTPVQSSPVIWRISALYSTRTLASSRSPRTL